MSKSTGLGSRFKLESRRFSDSWLRPDYDMLKKSLKYLSSNQYTLRIMRSKYFNKQLSKKNTYYAIDNNLYNLKYNLINNFYNLGSFGTPVGLSKTSYGFNYLDLLGSKVLNRIKQPIRSYLREKSPYGRNSYVILHQKILSIYLNKKVKYNKVRFLLKPLQLYFRDFFRFNFSLKNINHICRNQLNLININITNSFSSKIKLTRTKKIILNSRILYKQTKLYYNDKSSNIGLFVSFFNNIVCKFYSDIYKDTMSLDQIKKIIKWEFSINSKSLGLSNLDSIGYKNKFISIKNTHLKPTKVKFSNLDIFLKKKTTLNKILI